MATAYMNKHKRFGPHLRGSYRKRGSSGRGVTSQYDRTTVYRKRRMPKRKARRWKRFVKKAAAAADRGLGSKTQVFNDQVAFESGNEESEQLVKAITLYGLRDAIRPYNNDLARIATDPTIGNTGRILFKSGILDVTVANQSTDGNGSGTAVEVDVYLIKANRSFGVIGANLDLIDIFDNEINETNQITTQQPFNIRTRGVTPWDMTAALGSYKVKILNKKKYFLPPGSTFTYQIRDPKNRSVNKSYLADTKSVNMRGWTQHLLMVAKNVPGTCIGDDWNIKLNAGITRKYMYKINSQAPDYKGYANTSAGVEGCPEVPPNPPP